MEITIKQKLKKGIFLVSFLISSIYAFNQEINTISYLKDASENHKMDIYEAKNGNKNINILAIPSGGFVMTDKEDLQEKAQQLSLMGYRVFVPNYSDVMYSEVCDINHKTWYRPVQEIEAALHYLETHENITEIYLYGESAGGIVALNTGFLTKKAKVYTKLQSTLGEKNKLGSHHIQIKGIFTINAGVFDLSIFENPSNTPLFMIHATCDDMVPYQKGTPLMCDETNITLFGSAAIYQKILASKNSIPVTLNSVYNANHNIINQDFSLLIDNFITQTEKQSSFTQKKEIIKLPLSKDENATCHTPCN